LIIKKPLSLFAGNILTGRGLTPSFILSEGNEGKAVLFQPSVFYQISGDKINWFINYELFTIFFLSRTFFEEFSKAIKIIFLVFDVL